ncbi:hypothetical protein CL617_01620 [archaeon]|nr:hypothetical protein [archaeon]|tara:strand:- start:1368 stop:1640 length:273 start_codon:yes stop_codon:yes gene_type:complete
MAADLDTITFLTGLAGLGVGLGTLSVTLDFLDYHQQVVEEKKLAYRDQQKVKSQSELYMKKPTWINTLKDTVPEVVSNYKNFLKHPIKNL